MESYPKPRHQYVYTPRLGQRGFLTYAGQQPNGAYPTGIIPNAYGYGVGAGVSYAGSAYYPGVYGPSYYYTHNYHYPIHDGYYNYYLYGSLYPFANFYSPYQRSYYTSVPQYGYQQAYVYPPGPTTTTTTYHVTNSHAPSSFTTPPIVRETKKTTYNHGSAREDVQMENRRVATERGAYHPRRIKPADARHDDPFWCRERNGEWHLRTYYQIENECYPGRWLMDAEVGFLVFHRE